LHHDAFFHAEKKKLPPGMGGRGEGAQSFSLLVDDAVFGGVRTPRIHGWNNFFGVCIRWAHSQYWRKNTEGSATVQNPRPNPIEERSVFIYIF